MYGKTIGKDLINTRGIQISTILGGIVYIGFWDQEGYVTEPYIRTKANEFHIQHWSKLCLDKTIY